MSLSSRVVASVSRRWSPYFSLLRLQILRFLPVKRERCSVVVTLTSFPARFGKLHLTLYSLLFQSLVPYKIVLWIAHGDVEKLPAHVIRLQSDILEIRLCEDIRSYKKIIPALRVPSLASRCLVTADDDVYYRRDWLSNIVTASREHPEAVIACRAHGIKHDGTGALLSYSDWDWCVVQPSPKPDIFPTGAGGVLFPPGAFHALALDSSIFLELCPSADDVWLYWMVRMAGREVRTVLDNRRLITWRSASLHALGVINADPAEGNDAQIRNMVERFGDPSRYDL